MKKRIPALFLTLAIVFAMAVPSFAATVESVKHFYDNVETDVWKGLKFDLRNR